MTRSLIVLAVALALVGLLLLVSFLSVPHVRSSTAKVWRPVPAVLFSRWPARSGLTSNPLKVNNVGRSGLPAVPVGAGLQSGNGGPPLPVMGDGVRPGSVPVPSLAMHVGSSPTRPSILPSGRQRLKSGPSATEAPTVVRTAAIPDYVAEKGVAGVATWYRFVPGQAAAAARLRDNLGPSWRGMVVRVCASDQQVPKCLSVVLTDYESSTIPGRLVDLDASDFLTLCGPLSRGICSVVVMHG